MRVKSKSESEKKRERSDHKTEDSRLPIVKKLIRPGIPSLRRRRRRKRHLSDRHLFQTKEQKPEAKKPMPGTPRAQKASP